jgi:hypothetical protein
MINPASENWKTLLACAASRRLNLLIKKQKNAASLLQTEAGGKGFSKV